MQKGSSKSLTWLLRHGMQEIMENGYIDIDILISLAKSKYLIEFTRESILDWVSTDNKQRFHVQNGMIKAVQGHSLSHVKSDLLMERLELSFFTENPIHSTDKKSVEQILSSGYLKKMSRNCVHFSIDPKLRRKCKYNIELDIQKYYQEGHHLYLAKNNVICSSEDIELKYLKIEKLNN